MPQLCVHVKNVAKGLSLMGAINCGEPDISGNHASSMVHLILWFLMVYGVDHKQYNHISSLFYFTQCG